MIEERTGEDAQFKANDSICRQVSNREPNMVIFAGENEPFSLLNILIGDHSPTVIKSSSPSES